MRSTTLVILIASVLVTSAISQVVKAPGSGEISLVTISACPALKDDEVCELKEGTMVAINFALKLTEGEIKHVVLKVASQGVGGYWTDISYHLACGYLGLDCPLKKDEFHKVSFATKINRGHPLSDLYRITLYDERKNIIAWFSFPVTIKPNVLG